MSFRIVPLKKGTAPVIALYRPVLLIGRHPDCDIRLDSSKISRRHCCVAMAYDRVLIRDLGSRNGVRVNGRICEEARLYPGDELAIGAILFRLEQEAEEPEVPVAPSARPAVKGGSVRPGALPGNRSGKPIPGASQPADSDSDLVPLDDI
jgi:pSer/pThr/pTyr-binding forkhead associated (FHA) protein